MTFLPRSVAARFQRPGLAVRPVAGLSGSTAMAAWRAGSRDPAVAALVQAAVEVARTARLARMARPITGSVWHSRISRKAGP